MIRHSEWPQRLLFLLTRLFGKWLLALTYWTVHITNDPSTLHKLNETTAPRGIYAFWHSHQLSMAWHCRSLHSAILISASRDGEYIARIAASLGFVPVRGSSSAGGGPGLKHLVDLGQSGTAIAITPDGPRGPRYSIKPGVLLLAQKTGQSITPMAIGLSAFWELPSWDRFRIPKPFSRGYFCWGDPLCVPPKAGASEMDALECELKRRMMALERYADGVAAALADGNMPV